MQVDHEPGRQRRPLFPWHMMFVGGPSRGPLVGCIAAAALLAGCASNPGKPPGAQTTATAAKTASRKIAATTPAETPHASTVAPDIEQAAAVTQDEAPIAAAKIHYVPHQWPDPSEDLWSAIRAGFQLAPDSERRSVRVWTQFYATHTDHLSTSLQRARPYLWYIVQQLKGRDMPTELALLPIVESGYNASARSYVGASGLWQFMPGTADHMRLTRDWWYDGRNDPIASTDAALNYLQLLNHRYDGDWLLTLAAYNAGPGRIDDALAVADRNGQQASFWQLNLPDETEQYVPQLLALRRIMMTPAKFGVNWPRLAHEPRTRVVTLPAQTDMKIAANMLGMSEDALHKLNPGIRRWASGPNRRARLLVPADKALAFRNQLADIDPRKLIDTVHHRVRRGETLARIGHTYHVSIASLRAANHLSGDRIVVGQPLTIPRPGNPKRAPATEPSQTYVVQAGDTLWHIARRYHVSPASLRRANGHTLTTLYPGETIDIPGSAQPEAPTTVVARQGDTLRSIARANDVSVAQLRRWNRMGKNDGLSPGMTIALDGPSELPDFYEVEPGDSLWSIADRFSMQVNTLRSLNDMAAGSTIRPGERLRLQPAVSS